ncbi:MAG: hypothetical protein GXY61_06460 [Lentisphaerae bacterium]|nr:hypothetical protein [Lentisphaerota bacterium]
MKDPPFSRIDMVSCRKLLIYLQPPICSIRQSKSERFRSSDH